MARYSKKEKKPCKTIDAAEEAFQPVIDPESTEGVVEAGIKNTRSILERYVDRGSRKRAKKTLEKGKKKKVKVDEDESEEETVNCGGGMDDLPKDDKDDEGSEGNGSDVFDYISSGITA